MLLAKDVMTEDPVILQASDSATHARAIIRDQGHRAYPVLDDGRLAGILTRGDVLKVTSNKSNMLVKGIMSQNLMTANLGDDLFSCAKKILNAKIRQLVVVNEGKLTGIITSSDIIAAFLEKDYNPVKKKISEIMSTNIISCEPEDEIPGIWDIMGSSGFSGLPVVSKEKLLGMITRMDIFRAGFRLSKESGKSRSGHVQKIMKSPAIAVTSDVDTRVAAQAMIHKNIIRLPVVDEKEHLIGIVDIEDILRAYIN